MVWLAGFLGSTTMRLSRVLSAGAAPLRRSFTGELVGASEDEVTLAAESGVIAIPYSEIRRSNLLED